MEERLSALSQNDQSFEFKSTYHKTLSVGWARNASFIALAIGLYDLFYASFSPDPDVSFNLVQAFVVLIPALIVLLWSWKQSNRLDAPLTSIEDHSYLTSNNIFVLSALIATELIALNIKSNLIRDRTREFLTVQSSDSTWWSDHLGTETLAHAVKVNNYLATIYSWTQYLVIAYFLYVNRVAYKNSENNEEAVGNVILVTSIVLSADALYTVWATFHAEGYAAYPTLAALYPSWLNDWIFQLSIVLVIVSVLSTLFYFSKNRTGFLFLWVVLVVTLLFAIPLTGRAYQSAVEVHNTYAAKDTYALERLVDVHEGDVAKFWCSNKYLEKGTCPNSEKYGHWEVGKTATSADTVCVNTACASSLGPLYQEDFLVITCWSVAANLRGIIILVALSYFLYQGLIQRDEHTGKFWLTFFCHFVLIVWFIVARYTADVQLIREYKGEPSSISYNALPKP
jgi:hypothetical protein